MDHNKIWKIYDDKLNSFFKKSFEFNKDLSSYWGYDFIFREIFKWEHSETGCIYEMWDCVLKPNDIVVDIGSNVGFFSVKASKLASKVISIDGSPEVYSCLVENCKDYPNIFTLNSSVLPEDSEQSWPWSVKGNPLRMTLEDVMELFQLDRIDFLKCDIEGGEYDLFDSVFPETLSKIDRIAIETHHEDKNETFYIPGKVRHSFFWEYPGGRQTMLYFISPKKD